MDIALRSAAIFAVIYVVIRLIGRRELSELQPFDVIILVVVGDLVAQAVVQYDTSVTGALIAIATFAGLSVAVSYVAYRSRSLRPYLEGEPIVIVEHGKLLERNLRRERLTLEDVAEEARLNGIGDLDDIEWGVLETSGRISFVPRTR